VFGKNGPSHTSVWSMRLLNMIVTDAPLVADKPFEEDLCVDCDLCLKLVPLAPYSEKAT